MKASTLRLAFLLAEIAGAIGFQLGINQFAVKANVVPAPDGGVAGKLSWSSVPVGSAVRDRRPRHLAARPLLTQQHPRG